jgi:hypothetical protein
MAFASKAQFLKAKLPFRDVEVAEWGGVFRLQALSVRAKFELLDFIADRARAVEEYERDQALPEDECRNLPLVKHYTAGVPELMFSIIDPKTGERMFDISDYDAFEGMSYATINGLYVVFRELNDTMTTDRVKALKKTSA